MHGTMAYNVPLDAVDSVIGVSHNTAILMKRKLLETARDHQKSVMLSGKTTSMRSMSPTTRGRRTTSAPT